LDKKLSKSLEMIVLSYFLCSRRLNYLLSRLEQIWWRSAGFEREQTRNGNVNACQIILKASAGCIF